MKPNLEQSEVDLTMENVDGHPAESKQDSNEIILGKFNSVDELAKAYESLQSAFTKKSQELADLIKTNAVSADEKRVEKQQQTCAGNCKCSNAVIPPAPTVIAGNSGGFAFTNVSEALTLHATTKVAENFFKQKGERIT